MASRRYKQLTAQDKSVRRHLFPGRRNWSLVAPTKREIITAIAYRMFAHAEIESYLEDRALDLISACDAAYKTKKKVSITTLGLMGYKGNNQRKPPERSSSWKEAYYLATDWEKSVSAHFQHIKISNNGVKERNVLLMYVPLGVTPIEIDPLLLSELNSFGEVRGAVAHGTLRHTLSLSINPKLEFDRVDGILKLLLDFDDLVNKKIRIAS